MSSSFAKSGARALVEALIGWYRRHRRDLPWRRTSDPYRIWVSEVMLQQTRVTTVLPYYERFLQRFPDVQALASTDETDVLACWSGLGYYRRARQMQVTARGILSRHGGVFPGTYEQLLDLPGIGPYTAAAVASLAFGRPNAVVDGNVLRVLARWYDDDGDIRRNAVKDRIQQRAQQLLEQGAPRRAGTFNQAVMELGATLCVPRQPQCLVCPVAASCRARRNGTERERPVKSPARTGERLQLAVAVVRRGRNILLRQRPADVSLMPGFWELPEAVAPVLGDDCFSDLGIRIGEKLGEFRHGITFRDYCGSAYAASVNGTRPRGYEWIADADWPSLPLTTVAKKALRLWERSQNHAVPSKKLSLSAQPQLF